jgi:hypothetical protein
LVGGTGRAGRSEAGLGPLPCQCGAGAKSKQASAKEQPVLAFFFNFLRKLQDNFLRNVLQRNRVELFLPKKSGFLFLAEGSSKTL